MRYLLLSLIALVAITTLCTGLLLMYEPDGSIFNLPLRLLDQSPFRTFFLPGLVLTVLVGGTCLYALVVLGYRNAQSYKVAQFAGWIILSWTVGQMLLTDYFHWSQLLFLCFGGLVVLISYQLMGKAAF